MVNALAPQLPTVHFVLLLLVSIIALPSHAFADSNKISLRTNTAAPIVIPASQDWDGNDGPWSSFTLQVGTPAQDLKVFISTAATQTWVVVPEGCISSDPPNCEKLRGGEFLLNQSSTWIQNTVNISNNLYYLNTESNLGYNGVGEYGFDKVTLGWQGSGGPSLANQTVAGIATKDFYLGVFGLNPRSSNFSSFDDPIPSYLQNLRNQSLIPSTSWSYTAGNQYRLSQVLGSLVLGGYDASKFTSQGLSFKFNEEDIRDLTVFIENITTTNAPNTTSLLPTPISAYIDSTVPHIWLPTEACTLFEEAFGLSYDNQTELYLLNDSQHTALLSKNPSVTFTLSNLTAGLSVNITLPYAAFDLTVSSPIVANSTRYFPLKRASNFTQYTLGRTFLQEAYLIADYERGNFSVSQCRWDANAKQSIVPIYPPNPQASTTSSTPSPSPSPSTGSSSTNSSAGNIAGIAIGVFLLFLLLGLVAFYFLIIKPRRARKKAAATQRPEENNDTILKAELHAQDIGAHEMEGEDRVEVDGGMIVEIGGQQTKVYEMPALEEVAVEVGEGWAQEKGEGKSPEIFEGDIKEGGKGEAPEQYGRSARRKFSWEAAGHVDPK